MRGAAAPESAGRLIDRAEHLIGVRRYAEALPWLSRAIAAEPKNARGHCLMALALFSIGEHPRALEAAARALAADPQLEWPHRLRTIILLETGARRAALQAAREAVRLGPAVPEALYTLVQAQLASGNARDAQTTALRLVEIAPDRAMSYRALGHVAIREKRWAAAEAHLRRAMAFDPEAYETLNDLGLVLQAQGKEREAIDRFHDALKANPARREARENLFGALRRFLHPGWVILVAFALAVGAMAFPAADAALPAVLAAVILAYLWWRRGRLRTLPPAIVALGRRRRQRWQRRSSGR